MDQPVQAHTINEAHYYLMVTACKQCGKGPWMIEATEGSQADAATTLRAKCKNCQARQEFKFRCEHEVPDSGSEAEMISPSEEPSKIIDLGQWLSLFYLLVETAAKEPSHPETRRLGYRAALCLAEAMKFYGDNELPPREAFFSAETASVFREHPENFAREKLRNMQAKLPMLGAMARRISLDERARHRRRWWQFWRR
ncbi:MAG: hypothetical protein ACYTF6_03600 [Planctomycetota bacterium]|jgi:hypothetical protein